MSAAPIPTGDAITARLLALTAWRVRHRLAALSASIIGLAFVVAYALPEHFVSRASLVFLLGPEYTVREPAGASASPNTTFDPDHILGTEDAILSSPDLHRQTIAAIGIGRLYPKLLAPPSGLQKLIAAIEGVPTTIARLAGARQPLAMPSDPMDEAVIIFASHLVTTPSKLANVMEVGFTHRDPAVARDTLAAMLRLFLVRRRTLYAERQSSALDATLDRARANLDEAESRLADYRTSHAVSDYATQLDLALHAAAEIDRDAADARRSIAVASARRVVFAGAIARLPTTVPGGSGGDIAADTGPIREGLEALRSRQAETLSRYRPGSDIALALGGAIARRDRDLGQATAHAPLQSVHSVRNAALDQADAGALAAGADLASAITRLAVDRTEAASLGARISGLDAGARTLDLLVAARDLRLASYKQLGDTVATREAIEAVEASTSPGARVASAPSLPVHPRPTRMLILIAGTLMAIAAPVGAVLICNACRRTILLGGEIEALGVRIITEFPAHDMGRIVPIVGGAGR